MFELISLISVVLAIAAIASARGTRARLDTEIAVLKLELKRIEALRGGSAPATEPVPDAGAIEEAAPFAAEIPVEEVSQSVAEPEAETIAARPVKPKESFESRLAARWTVWVGGLALAFAGIFAVKYAIDQGFFSPEIRLSFAALFGLVLMGVGEWLRRRTATDVAQTFANAMIPGILTAAGSLTLFGVVFAAHGVYDFIGPVMAFILLCLISLTTLALSLLHGQGLAGLGLVASFVTPLLVTSSQPNPWPLFGFLSIAWIASTVAARIREWRVTPAVANLGLSAWAFLYVVGARPFEVAPVTLAMLIMIAGLAFIWPGRWTRPVTEPIVDPIDGDMSKVKPERIAGAWEQVLLPRHLASTLIAALGVMVVAVVVLAPDLMPTGYIFEAFTILTVALALFGAYRTYAIYPAIFAALAAIGGMRIVIFGAASTTFNAIDTGGVSAYVDPRFVAWFALGLGLFFAATGIALAYLRRGNQSPHSIMWSVIGTATPLLLAVISFVFFGNYFFDLRHGLYAIILGIAYLAAAHIVFRGPEFEGRYVFTRDLYVAASWAAFIFALLVMTNDLATTLGAAFLGFAYLLAGNVRNWPSLPWGMAASAIFVAGRIAWEPTIVGADHLSRTPVFNALLIGYGVPSLLLIISAWLLRRSEDVRVRSVMEALASLFTLLTMAILVRHAMNGGVLNDAAPTLGEQAIYTLLTIGASATLMALDLRKPSIVFRFGSMAVGYISMISVISAHYVGLNPYFTGEMTGKIPFFNLLFLAYLLPGIAYGGAAWLARDRRPFHYVVALALTGASLLFAYVSLTVRRVFHGEDISDWKGFLQPELYTYSVVWLLLGVALLVFGYRFRAKSIRIASAVLVLIAVVKVFLVDMSNLEGLFRVLSFIGLGVALIGIGRFYQTILTGLASDDGPKAEMPAARPPATPSESAG
ncbi:MAG: hypothetical protein JWM58_2031 [Rhizobium sp.]|nr:hypothetical protein [Rhizobium sp.]